MRISRGEQAGEDAGCARLRGMRPCEASDVGKQMARWVELVEEDNSGSDVRQQFWVLNFWAAGQ